MPMSDDHVETYVLTELGELHIQEYLVKHKFKPRVYDLKFRGLDKARATKHVLNALRSCKAVVIGPSNPINSIGPILAVKGVKEQLVKLRESGVKIVAVSPIIGSKPVSGPAHIFLEALGYESSPLGVAEVYSDVVTAMVIHESDEAYAAKIRSKFGIEVYTFNVIMNTIEDKIRLAKFILSKVLGEQ